MVGKLKVEMFNNVADLFYSEGMLSKIKHVLNPQEKEKILDVPCGTGTLYHLTNPADYIGIDIDSGRIEDAKKCNPDIDFRVGSADATGFNNGEFDKILVAGLFHHLNDELFVNVLQEMERILKSNGKIVILEAIWPKRFYNLTGYLGRMMDEGKYVRYENQYLEKFEKLFNISHIENLTRLTFEYSLIVLEKKGL